MPNPISCTELSKRYKVLAILDIASIIHSSNILYPINYHIHYDKLIVLSPLNTSNSYANNPNFGNLSNFRIDI